MAEGAPQGHTVLVVDDQPEVLGALSVFLRYSFKDLAVRAASSAGEALDVLRRERVDVVVADYRMPGMDGLRFLEAVGQVAPGVPRILFTAHWDEARFEESVRSGIAERFLAKSGTLEALAEGVQGFLSAPPTRDPAPDPA